MERPGAIVLLAAATVTVLLTAVGPSATAQYSPTTEKPVDETTTTTRQVTTTTRPAATTTTREVTPTSAPSSTSTTRETTTTVTIADDDDETPTEEPSIEPALIDDGDIEAGETTGVAANFTPKEGEPAIPPGSQVTVQVEPAAGGAPVFSAIATVNADGTVSVDVSVPEGTQPGVFLVTIVLPADGSRRPQVAIAGLVVRRNTTSGGASRVEIDPEVAAKVAADRTPPVQAIVDDVAAQVQDAGEQSLVDAVTDGGELSVASSGALLLDGLPVTGADDTAGRAVAAAAAVGAAGAGLLIIRRRTSLGSAR